MPKAYFLQATSSKILAQLRFLIAVRPGHHPKTGLLGREKRNFKNHPLSYYNAYFKVGTQVPDSKCG